MQLREANQKLSYYLSIRQDGDSSTKFVDLNGSSGVSRASSAPVASSSHSAATTAPVMVRSPSGRKLSIPAHIAKLAAISTGQGEMVLDLVKMVREMERLWVSNSKLRDKLDAQVFELHHERDRMAAGDKAAQSSSSRSQAGNGTDTVSASLAENAAVQQKLHSLITKNSQLESQVADLTRQIADLPALRQAAEELAELRKGSAERKDAHLDAEVKKYKKEILAQTEAKEEAKRELVKVSGSFKKAEADSTENTKLVKTLRHKIAGLESAVSSLKEEERKLKEEDRRMKEEVSNWKVEVSRSVEEKNKSLNTSEELRRELGSLNAQLKAQAEGFERETMELKVQVRESKRLAGEEGDKRVKLEKDIASIRETHAKELTLLRSEEHELRLHMQSLQLEKERISAVEGLNRSLAEELQKASDEIKDLRKSIGGGAAAGQLDSGSTEREVGRQKLSGPGEEVSRRELEASLQRTVAEVQRAKEEALRAREERSQWQTKAEELLRRAEQGERKLAELLAGMDELRKQIEEVQGQKEKLEEEVRSLREDRQAREIREKQAGKEGQEALLEERQGLLQEISRLKGEVKSLEGQTFQVQEQTLQVQELERAERRREKDGLEGEIRRLKEEIQSLRRQVDEPQGPAEEFKMLREEVSKLAGQRSNLEQERVKLEEDLRDADRLTTVLRSELAMSTERKLQELASREDTLQRAYEDIVEVNIGLKQQVVALTMQLDLLHSAGSGNTAEGRPPNDREGSATPTPIPTAPDAAAGDEFSDLEMVPLHQLLLAEKEIADLKAVHEEAARQSEARGAEIAELKSSIAAFTEQLEASRQEAASLRLTNESLGTQLAELQASLLVPEGARSELEAAREEIASLQAAQQGSLEELRETTQVLDLFRNRMQIRDDEIQSKTVRISKLETDLEELQATLEAIHGAGAVSPAFPADDRGISLPSQARPADGS